MDKRKTNILFVEDDINLGLLLKDFLERAGYLVTLCRDGEEGFCVFKENLNKHGLCILDGMLPKKDGFTLAFEIRKLNRDIPIIFLTASNQPGFRQRASELNAAGYFEKPYEPKELLTAIQAALSE